MSTHHKSDDHSLRMVVTICLCIVLTMSTWFSTAAVVPQLRAQWHISDVTAAWFTIAVQLGFVAGAVIAVAGRIADRVAPRELIVLSAVGAALANLGLVWVGNTEQAIALRLMTGIFMAGIYPPALKLAATWSVRHRGLVFGAVIGSLTLGSALPHLINATGGASWRLVVVLTSIATATGGAAVLLLTRPGPHAFPKADFRWTRLGDALTNRTFLLITIGYLGHMWELYAAWSWMLVLVRARLGEIALNGGTASLLTFLIMVAGVPACIAAGYIADRYGRIATTGWFLGLSGLCAALIGLTFSAPLWLFVAVGLVWGATVIGDSGQFSALVTERGDRELVGTALTAQLGLGFALTAITIWLVPVVARQVGWQWAAVCLVPGPIVGVIALRMLARTATRSPDAPSPLPILPKQ